MRLRQKLSPVAHCHLWVYRTRMHTGVVPLQHPSPHKKNPPHKKNGTLLTRFCRLFLLRVLPASSLSPTTLYTTSWPNLKVLLKVSRNPTANHEYHLFGGARTATDVRKCISTLWKDGRWLPRKKEILKRCISLLRRRHYAWSGGTGCWPGHSTIHLCNVLHEAQKGKGL